MKDNRTNYVIVGVFVLLMVAALLGAVAVILGRTGPTAAYYTVYENVGGLRAGTQVMFEGYPIGQVDRIEPVTENGRVAFQVHMEVDRNWRLPADSEARIAASGLLAAVNIDIRGGASPDVLEPGSRIPGRNGGSVFAVMDEVATDVRDITRETIRPLLDQVSVYITSIGGALEADAPQIMGDIRRMVGDIADRSPAIAGNLTEFTEKLNSRVMSEQNLGNIDSTLANTEAASASFNAMSRDLQTIGADLNTMITSIDALVEESGGEVRAALADMRYSLDTVARSVDSITHNIDSTSRNMLEFSRALRQNPGLLIGGAPPRDEARPR